MKFDYGCAYCDRGFCYFELGEYEEAIDDFTEAIELGDLDSYCGRGKCYMMLEQYEEAIENFTEFINLYDKEDKKLLLAYSDRLFCYTAINDYKNAIEDCEYILDNESSYLYQDVIDSVLTTYETLKEENDYDDDEEQEIEDDYEDETALEKPKTGKVNIAACTKQELMMMEFISEETAEKIIQAREDGIMWYDYKLFAQQFNIQPHLWADVEEKIAFPLKQVNKHGRKLDF